VQGFILIYIQIINSSALLIKELRYYARFIVVCLLLEKMSFAKELAGELTQMINDYVKHMKPHEMQEWQLVLQEITLFLQVRIFQLDLNYLPYHIPILGRLSSAYKRRSPTLHSAFAP